MKKSLLGLFSIFVWLSTSHATEVNLAVAANFSAPVKLIAEEFKNDTGHKATISLGSTGKFYSQIKNGAPFEVFLSADDTTPARLVDEGHAVSSSRFTYAVGALALWSKNPSLIQNNPDALTKPGFNRLAIANPKLAPYGQAAMETLAALKLQDKLKGKLVEGENIGQTYQFVSTGNADAGFVALSQIQSNGKITEGSAWLVPQSLYKPILQDAVLLNTGKSNPAAQAFMDYLKSDKAKKIILNSGYSLH